MNYADHRAASEQSTARKIHNSSGDFRATVIKSEISAFSFGWLNNAVGEKSPATRNRTRDHLIAAALYSQMLYQLSYRR